MAPPNEQWTFIHNWIDKIEKREKDIIVLNKKYERDKTLVMAHGISSSDFSSGMSIFGCSSGSRRTSRPSQVGSSGNSACH